MSQDEHHEHDGGHELEGINVMSLFKLIGVSIVLVYASIVGMTQLFYQQRAGIILDNSEYTFLEDQRAQEGKLLAGIQETAAQVAKSPKKLVAFEAPEGWMHPDDIAAGAAATPAAGAGDAPSPAGGAAQPAGEASAAQPAAMAPKTAAVAAPASAKAVAKPATPDTATKK
jgi:hypothetical protein